MKRRYVLIVLLVAVALVLVFAPVLTVHSCPNTFFLHCTPSNLAIGFHESLTLYYFGFGVTTLPFPGIHYYWVQGDNENPIF